MSFPLFSLTEFPSPRSCCPPPLSLPVPTFCVYRTLQISRLGRQRLSWHAPKTWAGTRINGCCYNAARSAGLYGNIIGPGLQFRPASSRLTARRPQQWLCTPSNFIIFTADSSGLGWGVHVVSDNAGVVHRRQWEQLQECCHNVVLEHSDCAGGGCACSDFQCRYTRFLLASQSS